MLRVTQVRSPEQYEETFRNFDFQKQVYIVSDLRSKKVLQDTLIERFGYAETQSVLRASDFWKQCVLRDFPEWQVLSHPLYQSYLDHFLCENGDDRLCAEGPIRTLTEFLNQLSPLYFRNDALDILEEVFQTRPQMKNAWEPWADLLSQVFAHFKAQQWLPQQWIPGFLLNQNFDTSQFDRTLIVDLKHDISPAELQLFQDLARVTDVELLVPMESDEHKENETSFYEMFLPGHRLIHSLNSEKLATRRFPSTLSELKWLTASIREDLSRGHKTDEIVILSATPELTSSLLVPLFQTEGLPLSQNRKWPALYWIEVQRWLSQLSLHEHDIQSSQVEISLFSKERKRLPYKSFKKLLSRIYGSEDLKRFEGWDSDFETTKSTDILKRDEFVKWTLQYWDESTSSDLIVKFYKQVFEEIPASVAFSRSLWLRHIKRLIHRLEILTERTDSLQGIEVLNYSSLDRSRYKKIYVCGLSEENLRRNDSTQISKGDVMSLIAKYGVALHLRESNLTEKELLFDMAQTQSHIELLFSETDALGKLQNPPVFWLRLRLKENQDIGHCEPSWPTYIDQSAIAFRELYEAQQSVSEGATSSSGAIGANDENASLLSRIHREAICQIPIKKKKISASGLEDFARCPYIFAARRLFHQSDDPAISLDLDAMSEGSLMHMYLENLLKSPEKPKDELLEELKPLTSLKHFSGLVWNKLKKKYIAMGESFLTFEKEFYGAHQKLIQHFVEVKAQGYVDEDSGEFRLRSEQPSSEWSVSGSVDRVDIDPSGHAVILDYKKSGTDLYNHDRWINKGKIQLLFYVLCAEAGLLEIGHVQPVGAFYYVMRPLNRTKGGGLSDHPTPLLKFETKAKNKFALEEFQNLKTEFKTWMSQKLKQMSTGEFSPAPADRTTCESCQWRFQCRARHLY